MKRLISILLCVLLLSALFAVPSLAEAKPTVRLSTDKPRNGEEVELIWNIPKSIKKPYQMFWAGITVYYSDDSTKRIETDDPDAVLKITPEGAVAVSGYINVVDKDENFYAAQAKKTTLSNAQNVKTPMSVKITVNTKKAHLGDKLTGKWTLSGVKEPIQSFSAAWAYQYADGTQCVYDEDRIDDPSAKGLSLEPKEGEVAMFFVDVTGADGRSCGDSVTIPLVDKVKSRYVSLAAKKATVAVGDTFDLKAQVCIKPFGSTVGDNTAALTFSSSDKRVAKVSKKGVVTALRPGTATITATAKLIGRKAACTITVPPQPTSVRFGKKTYKGAVGDKITLKPILSPKQSGTVFKWQSSDKRVAAVKDGVVTLKKAGTAVITVITGNKIKAQVTIKVS